MAGPWCVGDFETFTLCIDDATSVSKCDIWEGWDDGLAMRSWQLASFSTGEENRSMGRIIGLFEISPHHPGQVCEHRDRFSYLSLRQ